MLLIAPKESYHDRAGFDYLLKFSTARSIASEDTQKGKRLIQRVHQIVRSSRTSRCDTYCSMFRSSVVQSGRL